MPQMCGARPQRDDEHHQIGEIRKEIIVKENLVRGFQKVNHERDAATAETFSCGPFCSGGVGAARNTSSNLVLASLLPRRIALVCASSCACKPAFSSPVKKACSPDASPIAITV